MTQPSTWTVPVGQDATTAIYEPATSDQRAILVCAHGAGGNRDDRGMVRAAETLRAAGLGVVRYNFLYKERGSGRPDPMVHLKQCVAAVTTYTREALNPRVPILIGGRSMGGRASSMLAADGFECDALLLLAYPLHPAGLPQQLRDAHLPSIRVPVLCFNGTRDALCRQDLMDRAVRNLRVWTMHWLDGADHSFHVLKSSGRTDAQVYDEIRASTSSWVQTLESTMRRSA